MATVRYHKVKIGEHELNAETLMLGYGYDPSLSEGSVKPPVFLTSTFVFQTAEQGRDFFDYLAGRRAPPVEGQTGLVYSRFNHPNLEIVEDRLAIHEKAASGLVFASGMAAIVTLMLAYVRPGETVLHSRPLYGGTEVLIDETLAPFGVKGVGFTDGLDEQKIRSAAERARADGRIAMIFYRDAIKSDEQPRRYRARETNCGGHRTQPRLTTHRLLRQHAPRARVSIASPTWR